MVTGRKPKPRELRLVEGNPGKRPLPPPDPSQHPLGRVPPGLSEQHRKLWNRVKRELPWLKRGDRLVVELLVRTLVQLHVSDAAFFKALRGSDDAGPDLSAAEFYRRAINNARNDARKLLSEVGGTAAVRTRLLLNPDSPVTDPVDDEYFGTG